MRTSIRLSWFCVFVVTLLATATCSLLPPLWAADWPMWGLSPSRNRVVEDHVATQWNVGRFDRRTGDWDDENAHNIKWFAQLGSQSYGNPVVAGGRVFVGTNNGAGYLARYQRDVDVSCLICFRESDGKFLWQYSSEKLPTGRVHDWPLQGICSAPLVEEDRMWFVDNRGRVVCLDTEGFTDGDDDGPMVGESRRLFAVLAGLDETSRTGHFYTQEEPRLENRVHSSVYTTPIVANGVLYITDKSRLYAIDEHPGRPSAD